MTLGHTPLELPAGYVRGRAVEAAASAKYDEMIRAEWASLMDPDHDGLYPGNPDEAQDRIRQAIGSTEWSRWELTCHEIELSSDT